MASLRKVTLIVEISDAPGVTSVITVDKMGGIVGKPDRLNRQFNRMLDDLGDKVSASIQAIYGEQL